MIGSRPTGVTPAGSRGCCGPGELTPIRVPQLEESVRDLCRAWVAAVQERRRARHRLGGFLLRHGRVSREAGNSDGQSRAVQSRPFRRCTTYPGRPWKSRLIDVVLALTGCEPDQLHTPGVDPGLDRRLERFNDRLHHPT